MPLYRATAITLRRRSFEETDKLLTLFTREHGKLSAVAKGARRSQSRLVGATEPLVYASFQLATGRNLDIVSEARTRHTFHKLHSTPAKIQSGLYLAELTDGLVEEREEAPRLFDLLLSSLHLLENRDNERLIVARFEVQSLQLAGYMPQVERCVFCDAERKAGRNAVFSPIHGGVLCTRCRTDQAGLLPGPAEALDCIQRLSGVAAHALDSADPGLDTLQTVKKITQAHIQHHLQREIKSGGLS